MSRGISVVLVVWVVELSGAAAGASACNAKFRCEFGLGTTLTTSLH